MAITDYYFSRKRVPSYGNMFFLKVLQEADDPGGGESLLGTLAEEEHGGWFFFRHSWYPVPRHMSQPSIIRIQLENRRQELGIEGDVALEMGLAAGSERITVKKGASFEGSAASFPSVPAEFGVHVDYSRMAKAVLTLGSGSKVKYIPYDYIARLHKAVDGDDKKILDTGLIGDNNIIDSILLARKFTMSFESESDFDAEFWAKAEAISGGPQARVEYSKVSEREVLATVDSAQEYLVALSERNWDDFDPD